MNKQKEGRVCVISGAFDNPVGEIECVDKTINKEKKDWVYAVFENYNLPMEPKLGGSETIYVPRCCIQASLRIVHGTKTTYGFMYASGSNWSCVLADGSKASVSNDIIGVDPGDSEQQYLIVDYIGWYRVTVLGKVVQKVEKVPL